MDNYCMSESFIFFLKNNLFKMSLFFLYSSPITINFKFKLRKYTYIINKNNNSISETRVVVFLSYETNLDSNHPSAKISFSTSAVATSLEMCGCSFLDTQTTTYSFNYYFFSTTSTTISTASNCA